LEFFIDFVMNIIQMLSKEIYGLKVSSKNKRADNRSFFIYAAPVYIGSSYNEHGSISIQADSSRFPFRSHANVSFNTVQVSEKITGSFNFLNISLSKFGFISYRTILPSKKYTNTV